ncbi:MAG: hypothetical protein CM1200mP29_02690 [Verrucomicrobiota bacterium]|nr:MAG: hypothetical protein CM1200mP29_02690 [Verrucomicrobiota bacterium]
MPVAITPTNCIPSRCDSFYNDANGKSVMKLAGSFIDSRKKSAIQFENWMCSQRTFPQVRGILIRNKTFTVSSMPQIIGPALCDIKSAEIRTLSSTVFSQ